MFILIVQYAHTNIVVYNDVRFLRQHQSTYRFQHRYFDKIRIRVTHKKLSTILLEVSNELSKKEILNFININIGSVFVEPTRITIADKAPEYRI